MDFFRFLKGIFIQNSSDRSKQVSLTVSDSATTNTTTSLVAAQTANRTITLPDSNFDFNTVLTTTSTSALTNKTIDADSNTISNIDDDDIKAAAAIDATKIADGSVSNTEFQRLDGVTSSIQTQLSTNLAAIGAHVGSTMAHSAAHITNAPSGNLSSTDVQGALDELQTDLDGKVPSQTGENGKFLTTNGSVTSWATTTSGSSPTVTKLTASSGTYTTPVGCTAILVQMVGAGGAGGGTFATTAGNIALGKGGGGGAYWQKLIKPPVSTYAYICGTGGTGVSASNGNDGTASGFGSFVANAGFGGAVGSSATFSSVTISGPGGAGGATTGTGNLEMRGENGEGFLALSATVVQSGKGGMSFFGSGGDRRYVVTNDGTNAVNYGAGGGGALNPESSGTDKTGGNGVNGVILVTEYY